MHTLSKAALVVALCATTAVSGVLGGLVLAATGVVRLGGTGFGPGSAPGPAALQPAAPVAFQAAPVAPWAPAAPPVAPDPAALAAARAAVPPAAGADPLKTPEIAAKIMENVARLDAVATGDGRGEVPPERMVQVFFDPRCPYCHKAFAALVGVVPARWIPVLALGDEAAGETQAAAILAAAGKPDADKVLHNAFDKTLPGVAAAPEVKAALRQNLEAFVAVNGRDPRGIGVPTILVPRADGTVSLRVGFSADQGDGRAIVAEYGGRR